jgi:hypothetical protein
VAVPAGFGRMGLGMIGLEMEFAGKESRGTIQAKTMGLRGSVICVQILKCF